MDTLPPMDGHVVVMPYPGRGHINPLMHLCNLLSSKNSNILFTFVVTQEWHGFIGSDPKPHNIRLRTIPNVIPSEHGRGNDMVAFIDAVMSKMETPFEHLLDRLDPPPTFIVHDSYLFWVVGVGQRRNIPVASFFPMSASFFSAIYHYSLLEQNGHCPVNLSENGDKRVDYIPGLSSTRLADFPLNDGSWPKISHWVLKAPQWALKSQYLLFPSILELESQVIHALKAVSAIPIYTIGPVVPYLTLKPNPSSSLTSHDDHSYMKWLDDQPSGSVLYISQGSFLSSSTAQLEEIVAGLRASGVRFLWIAREESLKLKETCGDMGLVLPWCDQLRVLSHSAIGGFWSHCGWNSTREGAFSGVPFLAFPLMMDQPLNSKLIVEDWKIGWRVNKGVKEDDVLVSRDEVAGLLNRFMDLSSEEGRELRKRAKQVRQICQLAVADGGSSETNINAFLRDLLQGGKP